MVAASCLWTRRLVGVVLDWPATAYFFQRSVRARAPLYTCEREGPCSHFCKTIERTRLWTAFQDVASAHSCVQDNLLRVRSDLCALRGPRSRGCLHATASLAREPWRHGHVQDEDGPGGTLAAGVQPTWLLHQRAAGLTLIRGEGSPLLGGWRQERHPKVS